MSSRAPAPALTKLPGPAPAPLMTLPEMIKLPVVLVCVMMRTVEPVP